jgi:hypothetical protein
MKYKINSTDNIILADQVFMDAQHPGDYTLVPDDLALQASIIPSFDFYRRFTPAERIAVRALAKTDPIAEDFLHTLDSAIASQVNVRSDDPDTRAGLAYLEAMPVGNPVLSLGRSLELLA